MGNEEQLRMSPEDEEHVRQIVREELQKLLSPLMGDVAQSFKDGAARIEQAVRVRIDQR